MNNQWIENTSIIKKLRYSNKNVEKKIMFSLWKKKTSSQEMQNSRESIKNIKVSKNTNTDNYDNKNMQKRMMSNNDMSTTLLTTEHD